MAARIREAVISDGTLVTGTYDELSARFGLCRSEIRRRMAEGKPLDIRLKRGVRRGAGTGNPTLPVVDKKAVLDSWICANTPFTKTEYKRVDKTLYDARKKWLGRKV